MKYLRRGSGYYIDVGASDLLIEGKVGLKATVAVGGAAIILPTQRSLPVLLRHPENWRACVCAAD